MVLTAYHCATNVNDYSGKICDHSDGRRLAILGEHEIDYYKIREYATVPVIKVFSPPNGPLTHDITSHDFALLLLKHPVKYTNKVGPICLPEPHAEYGGLTAVAAGWGRTDLPSLSPFQSPVLMAVKLNVSTKKYKHKKMFGTVLSKSMDNKYQDPCSGDSGEKYMFPLDIQKVFN